jgi:hypothetical protein
MVIGEKFVWAHLPKTGGDATLAMFELFPDLVEFADSRFTDQKHAMFRVREEALPGRLLVMNIRRLPSWALARAIHRSRHGGLPELQPMRMGSPHEMAVSSFPDLRLSTCTDDGRFQIDRWLRMEFLAEDFLAFVSEFTEVDEETKKKVLELGPINAQKYDHDLADWFTEEQIAQMYRNNPVWAAFEKHAYGNTLDGKNFP